MNAYLIAFIKLMLVISVVGTAMAILNQVLIPVWLRILLHSVGSVLILAYLLVFICHHL